MRKISFPIIALLLVAIDQISKWATVENIKLGEIKSFLPNIVSLTYLQNNGAAFSSFQNQGWFFIVVTVIFLSVAGYYFVKNINGNIWFLIGLTLVISGGVGNFIDRLRLGYVIDMIHLDFIDFAIFNVADSYLTVGVVILMLVLWREDDGINN